MFSEHCSQKFEFIVYVYLNIQSKASKAQWFWFDKFHSIKKLIVKENCFQSFGLDFLIVGGFELDVGFHKYY